MIKNKTQHIMDIEIQVAVQYVVSFMMERFTEEEISGFRQKLRSLLTERFEGHWYPEKPSKGSAYRCLSVENQLDTLLVNAAKLSGLSSAALASYLPKKLDLWIDPTEVSYRIGEHGPVIVIYKEGDDCVNSTSEYLGKVLKELPTITPVESVTAPTSIRCSVASHGNPLMNIPKMNNITGRRSDTHLSASAKTFVSRNGTLNSPFLNNRVLPQAINPLLNLDYLQKLQQWPLLAAAGYDPLAAQLVQNYLIMQELQRFETRRLALQSHYLKMQNMRWPKKSHNGGNRQPNHSSSTNNSRLQISA